jgi:hypothetical protein
MQGAAVTETNVELGRRYLAQMSPDMLARNEASHTDALAGLSRYVKLASACSEGAGSHALGAALVAELMLQADWPDDYARGLAALAITELARSGWQP